MAQPPANSTSINRLYKQSVYNAANERFGEVNDILITNDDRAVALVIDVGGFLGIGERQHGTAETAQDAKRQVVQQWQGWLQMVALIDCECAVWEGL